MNAPYTVPTQEVKPVVDLETLKTPGASEEAVRVKFTLSTAMRMKLRRASRLSGQDMSTIVEWLIRDHLEVDTETQPIQQKPNTKQESKTDDFDFDR